MWNKKKEKKRKKITIYLPEGLDYWMYFRCYFFGHRNYSDYITSLIKEDLKNPDRWIKEGLDRKFPSSPEHN